jgi:predicted O-linked N-acetylglucosamine transferase (SPINDLY family)
MAQRVREDRIDILVDLSGHTGGNRLPVFAIKPAPVAATWFGYMNTTGLSTVDYRISDAALCPPGCEALYSERIWRLPSAAAWSPVPDCPDPGPPPALARGHVRFASFNNWAKVSDAVLDVWARILERVPDADLLVVAAGGDTDAGRAAVRAKFAARGISASRILVEGTKPLNQFLGLVAGVDIALDPFPYSGGTTTLHTLWMAVPVIGLSTGRETGRVAEGLLGSVGLADLCTRSVDEYVDAAVGLAADGRRRADLRAGLRARMRAGPSMNGAETTANLEKAYRAMWHNRLKQWHLQAITNEG